jgi:hypothetical protein
MWLPDLDNVPSGDAWDTRQGCGTQACRPPSTSCAAISRVIDIPMRSQTGGASPRELGHGHWECSDGYHGYEFHGEGRAGGSKPL